MTGTTTTGDDRNAVPPAAAPEAEIARLRSTVLSGRGPGASPAEVLGHTRARTVVGDRPVALEREAVAREASAARQDADALLLHVVTARSLLHRDVLALRERWKAEPPQLQLGRIPGRVLSRLAASRPLRRAALGLAAALAVRALWHRGRTTGRRGRA